MVDGSIEISTKLSDKEFKKDVNSLRSGMDKIKNSFKNIFTGADPLKKMSASAINAESKIAELSKTLDDINRRKDNMEFGSNAFVNTKAKIAELINALNDLDAKRDEIASKKTQELGAFPYSKTDLANAVESSLSSDKEYNKLGSAAAKTELQLESLRLKMKEISAKESNDLAISAQKVEAKLEGLKAKLTALNAKATQTPPLMERMKKGFSKLFDSSSGLTRSIRSMVRMLGMMGVSMLVYSSLQSIKEGFQDLALYSSDVNDSLSALQSTTLQTRNALAAALAPVLISLTPVIEAFASKILKALNAVAAFNARLFGGNSTYLKAKAVQTDYAKSLSTTAKAAEKAQKAVMGFDELNILQNDTSSDSTSADTGVPDYSEMFEEVEIPKSISSFADKFKEKLDWVKNNLDEILTVVGAIAAGLLGWKLAQAFGASLGTAAGLFLALAGAVLFAKSAFDMINNGVNWDNLKEMLLGVAMLAGGITLAFGLTAGAVTLLILGIAMLVIGIRDWIKKGELSTETFWLMEAAIIAVGIALGVLIGWPALLVAAFAAAFLFMYKYWDEIKIANLAIWAAIETVWNGAKAFFSGVWNSIMSVFSSVGTWFKNIFTAAWEGIKAVFADVGSFFGGIWDAIKSKFTDIGTKIGDTIGGAFKSVINAILNFAETKINGFIDSINTAIGTINKIPGVDINKLDRIEIPKMAKGGIVSAPTVAMIGEAGREAVVPLDNNTGWIDMLVGKLVTVLGMSSSQNSSIPEIHLVLDGQELNYKISRIQNLRAVKTNGR